MSKNPATVVGLQGARAAPAVFTGTPYSAPMLIGIAGRAGTGKDTLARFISHRYGHAIQAFADPLREILSKRFGWPTDMWEDRQWKEVINWKNECGPFSPRSWMQWLGTDVLRRYAGHDIFVRLAFEYWDRHRFPLVLSDIRFNNEAQAVIDRGGFVIELRRDDARAVASHVSEAGLAPKMFHAVLTNDGPLSDMFKGATALIEAEGAKLDLQYELDLKTGQP